MVRGIFVKLFLFSLLASSLFAQEIITDRPDFTESPNVIPPRMVQIESGGEFLDFNTTDELTLPATLFRFGLGYNWELRTGFAGWTNITVNDKTDRFMGDLILEAKYQISPNDAEIPFAILFVSVLPTGDEAVSVGNGEFGVKFAGSYNISERVSMGMNVGTISYQNGSLQDLSTLVSLAFGFGLNDKLGAFLEGYAEVPSFEDWQPVINGGFTYLFTDHLQLDLYAGRGLNSNTPDLILGAGLAVLVGF